MLNLNMNGQRMNMQKMVRQALPLALTLVLGTVVVSGLNKANLPDMVQATLINGSPELRAAHARSQAEIEIKQLFDEGVGLLNEKQYELALKAFHRVLQLSPDMPEAYINAGYALLGQGQFSVARDFFEGALDLRRDQLNAYYGLAEALDGMGDMEGALGAMRTYQHLAPVADPFKHKAEAAIREWEFRLKSAREQVGAAKQDGSQNAAEH
jgi:tetratricopeptide (TPR) repeat protein